MRSQIRLRTLITFLTTILSVDLGFPILNWQLIQNSKFIIQNSQALAQTQDERKAEADRLLQQGIKQQNSRQSKAALQSLQQALTIYQEISDLQGEAQVLLRLSITYSRLKDWNRLIEVRQQELVIVRQLKDQRREALALISLGAAYLQLGDNAKAIEYSEPGLVVARAIQDRNLEKLALSNLVIASELLGDLPRAIKYIQQDLAAAYSLKDRQREGEALRNLGHIYKEMNDYVRAIEYYEQSLAVARAIPDLLLQAKSLNDIASIYSSLGEFDKEIDYYSQSVAIAQEFINSKKRSEQVSSSELDQVNQLLHGAINSLGTARLYGRGDYEQAIDIFRQALVLAQKTQNFNTTALRGLGDAYYFKGEYDQAVAYYQQALENHRQDNNLVGGRFKTVVEVALQANLGLIYASKGDFPRAIEYHQQSIVLLQQDQNPLRKASALSNLGHTLLLAGKLPEAEKALGDAIKGWESIRAGQSNNDTYKDAYKVALFDLQAPTYELLQQVLVAQNKTEVALEIAEQSRARAFVELLARRSSPQAVTQPTIASPSIQQIKEIAKAQNATLVAYSIIYDPTKPTFYVRVPSGQQNVESELFIWVVKPTGEVEFQRVDLKQQLQNTSLKDLVANSRQPNASRSRRSLQQLHQLLIQPIADFLPKDPNAHVIFIPQGSLFLVPFPALQDASGKYLIEQHTILTAPSIQVLELTHQQRQRVPGSAKDVLVVGNPTMPKVPFKIGEAPEQLQPLPGAEREAINIARLLNTRATIGNAATESAIVQQLPKARLIHLATHGLLVDIQGLGVPGAVVLASTSKDDGLLTANEILNLRLNAELVVLSACDTGRGRLTGDGVIGLSRSLITAGVPSVIVTLWKIPDQPTALLMSDFYRHLNQKPDKAAALRQAMLTKIKQYPNQPSAWAAFTLIGEAE